MRITAHIACLLTVLMPLSGLLANPPDSLWSRTYGGQYSDVCRDVQQTPDGGYVFAGTRWVSPVNFFDFWLFKIDANGDSLWSRTYGDSGWDHAASLVQTSDGGYLLAGHHEGNWTVVKTDAEGDSQWARSYGTVTGWGFCYSAKQTSDGGYILAGAREVVPENYAVCWLLKIDTDGDSLWSRAFSRGDAATCEDVEETSDGGYILGAATCTYGEALTDFWLIKTDANGDSLWSRVFGGYHVDMCFSVEQTSDGGYVMAGETWSRGNGGGDFWLVKTDASGDSEWTRTYGTEAVETCYSMQQTSDGGYILGGVRDTGVLNLWLLKADANGDSLWSRQFGGAEDDGCFSVRQASDGGFILGGETCSYGNPSGDAWILRLGPELSAPDRTVPRDFCALTNYPNPFNSATTIDLALPVPSRVRVQVYDILGRSVGTISDASYPSGQHTIPWRCPTCASGTYWISMRGDGFYLVRKAILLR